MAETQLLQPPHPHANAVIFPSARPSRELVDEASSARVAHTLAACTRCRHRKQRCDPGLPRCSPCERTGATCEYFDTSKGRTLPRSYVVRLQERVKALEAALADIETEENAEPDPETLVRDAAVVKFRETDESKYLGAASGTTMTRIVMQLAKQVINAKSIKDIISEDRARQVRDSRIDEENKPTSKSYPSYPLVSSCANTELPQKDLTMALLELFNVKVQTMYPVFHEPHLAQYVEDVYSSSQDPFKNFVIRMVIAIGMQRMETQYAGLGDSYYLAALGFFEEAIRPMNMGTLQCFFLIAEYSLLTPTRTAVFYVIGMGVRLLQELGYHEEQSLVAGASSELEIDLRRRVFWAIITMDYGLVHALGRPAMMATSRDRIDVHFFRPLDDKYITPEGILPGPFSTRKWIAIHFYEMRLLQLEIRRTLYQKKRATPVDDEDPWFKQMETKLERWRDASPNDDKGSGFGKNWFTGRYNTMVVFLFRPSPQISRPTPRAAILCYEACEYNIHMHKDQIITRSVETTWAFTQSIFMAINTILWCLSYAEVRQRRRKDEVESHLVVALDAIQLASERWPGVASARCLYESLIAAILKIYNRDGDVPVSANSPFDFSDQMSHASTHASSVRSRTTSPGFASPELAQAVPQRPHSHSTPTTIENHASPMSSRSSYPEVSSTRSSYPETSISANTTHSVQRSSLESVPSLGWAGSPPPSQTNASFSPNDQQFYALPTASTIAQNAFPEMINWQSSPSWRHNSYGESEYDPLMTGPFSNNSGNFEPNGTGYDMQFSNYWPSELDGKHGLDSVGQMALMHNLQTNGMEDLNAMIRKEHAFFAPNGNVNDG